MSEIRGEGSASPEQLIAEALEKNDTETSVARIEDSRSKREIRDALEHAEQEFHKTDRTAGVSLMQTLKSVLDEKGTLVIAGEKVREIKEGEE